MTNTSNAECWPQFRGVNGAGISSSESTVAEFGPDKNVLWSIPIGSGHSSPCIVGNSIYLTTYDAESTQLEVVSVNKTNGQTNWRRSVKPPEIEKGHPSFNPASSTPACDGERVVAYFGSFGLICFSVSGEKQWEVPMPLAKSYSGNATSPVIVGDSVILYRGNYVDHFLLAVDKQTGKQRWKVPQVERFTPDMACSSCPIVAGDKILIHSARSVQAVNTADGKQIWQLKCRTTATSTPIIAGNDVLITTWNQTGEPDLTPAVPSFEELIRKNDKNKDGVITKNEYPRLMIFHRAEGTEAPQNGFPLFFAFADRDKDGKITNDEWGNLSKRLAEERKKYVPHGLLSVRIDSNGELSQKSIRKLASQGIPEVPSPLYHEGLVYFVKNGGVLTCLDYKTGERVYRIRTKGRGTHYASPIIAAGKLYTAAGNGTITVLKLGRDPKVLATHQMDDATYATPAIVNGTIFVRTHSKLYAFGK